MVFWRRSEYRQDASNRLPLRGWQRWVDLDHSVWLVYLVFWFIQPYLDHEPLRKWLYLFLALALSFPFTC